MGRAKLKFTLLKRFDGRQGFGVTNFSQQDTTELAKLASRMIKLQVNIQDGDVMVSDGDSAVTLTRVKWKYAAH